MAFLRVEKLAAVSQNALLLNHFSYSCTLAILVTSLLTILSSFASDVKLIILRSDLKSTKFISSISWTIERF